MTTIIDVRSAEEYAGGHVPGAINIPVEIIVHQIDQHVPDKNAPISVYCHSGNRAGFAEMMLASIGYTNVENKGGLEWWNGEWKTGMQP